MKTFNLKTLVYIISGIIIIAGIFWYFGNYQYTRKANQILNKTGIKGGVIVHLGCDNGKLTASLFANESYLVQGISNDERKFEKARNYISAQGLYGKVSVDFWNQQYLPYADNIVNLLIAEDQGTISENEMMRVLTPNGILLVKRNGAWEQTIKPRPGGIDKWTHFLHGPDNNAVAQDTIVGPPNRVQWITDPMYAHSHELNSTLSAMVTSGDRLYYIWDESPEGVVDKKLPSDWKLIARDAFNGKLLWKLPITGWGWQKWHDAALWEDPLERAKMLRNPPATLPRRLVAGEDVLYVTLGYNAPVSVLDAKTGEKIRDFEKTELADEILLIGDKLLLNIRTSQNPPETRVWDYTDMKTPEQYGTVMLLNAKTGDVIWQTEENKMAPQTLSARNERIFYSNYEQVVCLDMKNGKEIWKTQPIQFRRAIAGTCGTLVPQDEVVLYAVNKDGGPYVHSFSVETGELLWESPAYAAYNAVDLFVADGLVWPGYFPDYDTRVVQNGLDPVTGEVMRSISVPNLKSAGHHYRCYRGKATDRYLLERKRGVEFVDLKGDNHMRNNWVRSACVYGALPANGLLYTSPHQCVCYPGVLLNYFNALSSGELENNSAPTPAISERLQQGPAWNQIERFNNTSLNQDNGDWPMYRRNAQRSGSTSYAVPEDLKLKWKISLSGELTPPVVADDRLFVAEKDANTLHAMDANTGKRIWQFTTGGKIDSPPTLFGQMVFFGSADGYVYCLRASDGQLVWRFMAAHQERRIVAFDRIESVWPVHGSVIVQNDATANTPRSLVYFSAGRSTFLDGGIWLYALDPYTGKVVHQNHLEGPYPDPYEEVPMEAGYMDGAKSDILVSDGADLYLFQERFAGDLTRITPSLEDRRAEGGGSRIYEEAPERNAQGKRLMATGGFFDDTYNEGTVWIYGNTWMGWARHMYGDRGGYGKLLVFDDKAFYGTNVMTHSVRVRRGFTLGEGERLFARELDNSKDKWSKIIPLRVRGMVLTGDKLLVAGSPDLSPEDDPIAALKGEKGCHLVIVSAETGDKLADYTLESVPVFDGMIAAKDRIYLAMRNGNILCLGGE